MKSTLIYLSIPFAVACTQKQETALGPKTSQLKQNEENRIIGVVSYDDKCTINDIETKCLKVKGGDDLNDTKTFVINEAENGFEVVDDKKNPRSFRLWLKDKNNGVDVFENDHVNILAERVETTSDDLTTIKGIESVAVLEK